MKLYSKLSKCGVWLERMSFLGHVISDECIVVEFWECICEEFGQCVIQDG